MYTIILVKPYSLCIFHMSCLFPKSVWAQCSSNSGGLSNIFSSSHLLIFTSSHPHIFSPSHLFILTSSHLHIFSSSHSHIFSSSHLHILSCPLALLPSCSLALLLSPSFLFLSWRRGTVPTRRHETQPFRTKWGSIAKNWGKIAISKLSRAILSHEMRFDRQKLRKNCQFKASGRNPFARHEVRSPKTEVKLRFPSCPAKYVKASVRKSICV